MVKQTERNRSRFLILFCLIAASLSAQGVSGGVTQGVSPNFGLILKQTPLLTDGENTYGAFGYTGTAIPWFAAPLGEKADLYLSGGISAVLENEAWKPIPELYRFEFIYDPTSNVRFELGRVPFQGSLPLSFSGLFDGAAADCNVKGGRLRAGVFYTGLLYKKAVNIVISREDKADYADEEVYFASRRVAAGVHWELPGIFDSRNTLSLSGLGQFDLNGIGADSYTAIHSQYLEAHFAAPLGRGFYTESGGVFELIENSDGDFTTAFAVLVSAFWLLPTSWQDSLSLNGRFSSGDWNDSLAAFLPVTAYAQGRVLRPALTGIAHIESAYTVKPWSVVSAEVAAAYYFRTDETSFYDPEMNRDSQSPLLGGEIYGALTWTPFTDVSFVLGGGLFLPKTGKVFMDEAAIKYRVLLDAVFSF